MKKMQAELALTSLNEIRDTYKIINEDAVKRKEAEYSNKAKHIAFISPIVVLVSCIYGKRIGIDPVQFAEMFSVIGLINIGSVRNSYKNALNHSNEWFQQTLVDLKDKFNKGQYQDVINTKSDIDERLKRWEAPKPKI